MSNDENEVATEGREERTLAEGAPVSRREFLKVAGIAGATLGIGAGLGGFLTACGEEATTTTTAAPRPTATTAAAQTTTTVGAGVEAGRPIKIGAVSPLTGTYASFGAPDKWIVSFVQKATADGALCGDGKNHPIEISNLWHTTSRPSHLGALSCAAQA